MFHSAEPRAARRVRGPAPPATLGDSSLTSSSAFASLRRRPDPFAGTPTGGWARGVTLGFLAVRMLGQGALTLIATTAVAVWFDRRRGAALGVVLAVGSVGISLSPLLLERLIADHGWRNAWLIEGLVIWAVLLPIARLGMRERRRPLKPWRFSCGRGRRGRSQAILQSWQRQMKALGSGNPSSPHVGPRA
jgi:MFS family permease